MAASRRRTTRSTKKSAPRRTPKKGGGNTKSGGRNKSGLLAQRPRRGRKSISIKDQGMRAGIALFILLDLLLVFFFIKQCAKPVSDPLQPLTQDTVKRPLQIEILNGCGVAGIANYYTEFLRSRGFDVVKTDNYIEGGRVCFSIDKTVVVDRRGNIKKAQKIAKSLGMKHSSVISEPNEAYLIDASVIIGADYESVPAWQWMEKE
ncbi:LytR C-terminal domain-containing protein [bacterium]|nr:LytR C-terminal domain-containing protein [bacterium]